MRWLLLAFALGQIVIGLLLWYALHSVNHLIDAGEADSSWLGPANLVSLVLATILLGWMLGMRPRPAGRAS